MLRKIILSAPSDAVSLRATSPWPFKALQCCETLVDDYNIVNFYCHVIEAAGTNISITHSEEFLGLYFNLLDAFKYTLQDAPVATIRNNQYNMIYVPQIQCHYSLDEGRYETLSIHFTRGFLKLWESQYPFLTNFLKKAESKIPAMASHTHLDIPPEVIEYVLGIANTQYTDDIRMETYYRSKIFDIVDGCFKQLTTNTQHPEPTPKRPKDEKPKK